jgi:hypothetical protein
VILEQYSPDRDAKRSCDSLEVIVLPQKETSILVLTTVQQDISKIDLTEPLDRSCRKTKVVAVHGILGPKEAGMASHRGSILAGFGPVLKMLNTCVITHPIKTNPNKKYQQLSSTVGAFSPLKSQYWFLLNFFPFFYCRSVAEVYSLQLIENKKYTSLFHINNSTLTPPEVFQCILVSTPGTR